MSSSECVRQAARELEKESVYRVTSDGRGIKVGSYDDCESLVTALRGNVPYRISLQRLSPAGKWIVIGTWAMPSEEAGETVTA